jgi:cyclase
MDIVASLYERNSLHDIIKKTAEEIFIPLTVGGGLRTIDDIREVLRAGADKVALNTAAIKNPAIIKEASNIFGSSTIVVSIEAKRKNDGSYEAYTDNGREKTGRDALGWAKEAVRLGAGEIIITSIDNEGTGKGFDVELTRDIVRSVSVPVVACGGAGQAEDVMAVLKEGEAEAVSIASLFHYNYLKNNKPKQGKNTAIPFDQSSFSKIKDISISELKRFLSEGGVRCRYLLKDCAK